MAPAQANQSILSGLDVLQEVIAAGVPLGSREVARRLQMEHSRANRILGTLAAGGMLQQNSESKYLPGPRIHVLSALSLHASGLIAAALPVLRPIQERGAVVALGTLWRDTVVYLLHGNPGDDLAATAGAHASFPRERSILGAVLVSEAGVELPATAWADRPPEENREAQRTWAARIGRGGTAAIAAVLPAHHPDADPPERMLEELRTGAEQIARAVQGS